MRNFIIGLVAMCSLYAQGLKVITQQISLSQEPMLSDSLVLKGSLGKNFHRSGIGDTLTLKGGIWNICLLYTSPSPRD